MDERLKKIAENLINYSLEMKHGEAVLIQAYGEGQFELADCVAEYAEKMGIGVLKDYQTMPEREFFWSNITPEQIDERIRRDGEMFDKTNATCIIREEMKVSLSGFSKTAWDKYDAEITEAKRLKKRWCLTSVPKEKDLLEVYLNAASINYTKFEEAMEPLNERLKHADEVKIIAPNTNITFSIKGLPSCKCLGKRNIPDGELFTAPIKNSINGYINFNIPNNYNGFSHENVMLIFKEGKIIDESSNNTQHLTEILNTDEGARYTGEFAFGLNPFITSPTGSTLYDEKISESIHLTPGSCYARCNNGNDSAIHYDLVQIQTKEYGGGEIYLDGELIRKDGLFIPQDLQVLNPDNLIQLLTEGKTV